MDRKGQLSFDLYFAIIFAVILSQQLFSISGQFMETSNDAGIIMQEKQIANNIASIIESTKALEESDFTIGYFVPAIFDIESKELQQCDIGINSGLAAEVKISYTKLNGKKIETSVPITVASVNFSPADPKCNGKIIIMK